jgi:hypothetical protein
LLVWRCLLVFVRRGTYAGLDRFCFANRSGESQQEVVRIPQIAQATIRWIGEIN